MGDNLKNRQEIGLYLEQALAYWRGVQKNEDHVHHDVAKYYVDAFASIQESLVNATRDAILEHERRYFVRALGGLSWGQGYAQIAIHWDSTGSYGPYYNVWASRERDGLTLTQDNLSERQLFELLDQFVFKVDSMPSAPQQHREYDRGYEHDEVGWFDIKAALKRKWEDGYKEGYEKGRNDTLDEM